MSAVRVSRGKATVEVESDLWGDFTDAAVKSLASAVLATLRAIDTVAARELAGRIEDTP